MAFPGSPDPSPDLLSGGDRSRLTRTVLVSVAVGVLAIAAVVLAVAGGHSPSGSRRTAATATPATGQRAPVSPGSVFLEHLPKCTRTDHRNLLSVAFAVNNLGSGPLLLLGASSLSGTDGVLRLNRVRLGVDECADRGRRQPIRLAPSDVAVVAMTFHVSARCPHDSLVAARVTFDAGAAGIVHSDSSALTDVRRLSFAQC